MSLLYVLLACSIGIEICFAQSFDQIEVDNYLEGVENAMLDKVNSYGLSNLPDVDVKIYYNITNAIGYDIVGNLYMEDGFVKDLASLKFMQDGHWSGNVVNPKNATINGDMKFQGLEFFRNFRFEVDKGNIPDRAYGGLIIKPNDFYFSFSISHDLINDNVTFELGKTIQGRVARDQIDFNPENMFTDRLKKARPYGDSLFPELLSLWTPILDTLLEETIRTMTFPPLHFRSSRMRKGH